ncbi:MAG: hypothetical protein KDB79_03600 [Acidobacteria bacterium]|nr:hypothetical protein [Acidobacteriota bacterium]
MMKYTSENEILKIIETFENGTIAREEWGHPEHLILAYHYSINNDFETALAKMRDGIFGLLRAFEVDLTKEMPYHETLTVFWMKTVFGFTKGKTGYSIETISEMIKTFDKDYPARFYSREFLFSAKARSEFVEPDLAALTAQDSPQDKNQ